MSTRKPIPPSQRDISISKHHPYEQSGPGFQPTGNPNDNGGINRAEQISFKNDNTKPFNIGIQDIDESIMYYFTNVIKPQINQNGDIINVPIIYGSPEKWASFQKFGYIRDNQGRIMMPIIMFKRDNIDKVRTIANKLDANNPNNIALYQQKYSIKNSYDNFNILNNIKPQIQNYIVVIPDYITLTYSCSINTYYMEQMNKIIEAIEYASDSYWGDPSRFQFRAMIDSFAIKNELLDNEERVVSSTFTIKLNGYIIPDIIQRDITLPHQIPGVSRISISEQTNNI